MASIIPEQVKEYSTFKKVKSRSEEALKLDILEAESYVEGKLNKELSDFEVIPDKVELALLKVAQFYALANMSESMVKGFKSEKIGDYSYTLPDGTLMNVPDISSLIKDYITGDIEDGTVFLRMRSL